MGRGQDRGLGIDWNFPLHRGQIDNRGEAVIHEVGLRCTCNNEDIYAGFTETGAHVSRKRRMINCERCGGEGYLYRRAKKIIGIVTGIRETKTQIEGGWAMPGDSILSVKPGVEISGGDLITFTWPQPIADGQVVRRGASLLSDNATRKLGLESDEDRLWYNAYSSIYCEDEDGYVYESNADFILDTSKIIKWTGSSPATGKIYTIKYNAYLEWIAFLPPEIRRDRGRDLGTRVVLRKRHVANPNVESASAEDKVLFCDRISCD